jgi:hypothetical protein
VFVLSLVGVTALTSFVLVFPLWYFSTRSGRAYSFFVLSTLGAVLLAAILARIWRSRKSSESYLKERLTPFLVKTLVVLVGAALLYLVVWLFSQGAYYFAVPALLLFLAFSGLMRYGKKRV